MTLVVEDGSGVATANSFVDVATATTFFAGRLHTEGWDNADAATREAGLIWVSRGVDRLPWVGYRATTTQALAWPRIYVPRRDPLPDDLYYPSDEVPAFVVEAVCEGFLAVVGTDPTVTVTTGGTKKLKADVLEIEYFEGATASTDLLPNVVWEICRHALALGGRGIANVVRV